MILSLCSDLLRTRFGARELDVVPKTLLEVIQKNGTFLMARESLVQKPEGRLDGWYENLLEHGQTLRFYEHVVAAYLLKYFPNIPIVEVGSGMGFFAVLMAMMDRDVYSVEEDHALISLQKDLLNDVLKEYPLKRIQVTTDAAGKHLTFQHKTPRLTLIPGSFPQVGLSLPREAVLVFGNVPETETSVRRALVIEATRYFRFTLFDANQFYCYFPDHLTESLQDFHVKGLYPRSVKFIRQACHRFFPLDFPVAYYLLDSESSQKNRERVQWHQVLHVRALARIRKTACRSSTRGEITSIANDKIVGWIEHSSKQKAAIEIRIIRNGIALNSPAAQVSYSANGVHHFVAQLPSDLVALVFVRDEMAVYAISPGSEDTKLTVNWHAMQVLARKYVT